MCMWATRVEEGEKRKKRVKRQPLQKYNFEASWIVGEKRWTNGNTCYHLNSGDREAIIEYNGVKSKTTNTKPGGRWDRAKSRVKTTLTLFYLWSLGQESMLNILKVKNQATKLLNKMFVCLPRQNIFRKS